MLTNGQFLSSFVFTLCALGTLVVLISTMFVITAYWSSFVRVVETICGAVIAYVKNYDSWFMTCFTRSWQTLTSLLATFSNLLHQVLWGRCINVASARRLS